MPVRGTVGPQRVTRGPGPAERSGGGGGGGEHGRGSAGVLGGGSESNSESNPYLDFVWGYTCVDNP